MILYTMALCVLFCVFWLLTWRYWRERIFLWSSKTLFFVWAASCSAVAYGEIATRVVQVPWIPPLVVWSRCMIALPVSLLLLLIAKTDFYST